MIEIGLVYWLIPADRGPDINVLVQSCDTVTGKSLKTLQIP